ncbi:uncharacterized protein [Setaria viridis]|uniref:uncharacterized protein n=1 Tax=Setaria viridis TaxID=4556 RepID=UPI003B3AE32F
MAARRGSPGPLADALETKESRDQGSVPNKRIKIEAAAMELVGGSTTDGEEKQQRKAAAAAVAGDGSNSAAESVASSRDKALVRDAARSTVSVSSIALDGKVIDQQTGIVICWKETKKCARILTSSDIVDGLGPNIKLHIGLPNRTILEGQLLFFNKYYDIALLEISSESDLPLQLPSFGSNPNYGQEVFILARGKDSNLMARHGRVLWFEDPKYLNRNYLMLLSLSLGWHLIMVVQIPNSSILAISTILTCIEMWMKFSRIARPEHGLSLRTVELLEVSLQAVISLDHNINNGYIVDKVSIGSTAEKLGIRYGDVIVSFDGLRDQALPQLEDYLLSLGWGFLQGSTDSSSTVDLKLEVYDLLERGTRSVTLSVEFCHASE